MKAEMGGSLLSVVEKHSRIFLLTPFALALVLVILYYVGGPELWRLLDFVTFSR